MTERYNFEKHVANTLNWERKTNTSALRLSDWNCGRNDPQLPTSLLESASLFATSNLTTYAETSVSLALGEKILDWLQKISGNGFATDSAVHIYGNATQAILAAIYSIQKEEKRKTKFLLIHPSYYSIQSIFSTLKIPYIEHWRKLQDNGLINLDELKKIWTTHQFNAIIITDPMYSTGIEFCNQNLSKIINFAAEHDIWITIDSSFSGLTWKDPNRRWLDLEKFQRQKYKKCIVIDSPSKRLFTNNLKLGIIHCSKKISSHFEKFSDSFTGNITGMQLGFAKEIFNYNNNTELNNICSNNTEKIKNNFLHLLKLTNNSGKVELIKPDSGFHTMLFLKGIKTGASNPMKLCATLLRKGVFALPTNDYYYHENDPFGFRINLMNQPEKWESIVKTIAEKGLQ